jgi:hypothetical protein
LGKIFPFYFIARSPNKKCEEKNFTAKLFLGEKSAGWLFTI